MIPLCPPDALACSHSEHSIGNAAHAVAGPGDPAPPGDRRPAGRLLRVGARSRNGHATLDCGSHAAHARRPWIRRGDEQRRMSARNELVRLARSADPNRRLVEAAHPVLERPPRSGRGVREPRHPARSRRDGHRAPARPRATRRRRELGRDRGAAARLVGREGRARGLGADELEAALGSAPLSSFTERTITGGSVFRTELARIRRQGWAEIVDELEEGLAAISVPVLSARGGSPRSSGSAARHSGCRRADGGSCSRL